MGLFRPTIEERLARRARDKARWARPLTRPLDRLSAWINMLFVDHGIFRVIYPNFHWLSPRAARSAQPGPGLLRRFHAKGGRSVVSLRGGLLFGSLPLETETCAALGLGFSRLVVRSRELPTRAEFAEIVAAMRAVETPVLYHCKSGADRVGFVSVLHMHLIEGAALPDALRQLSLRYGHFRAARTGVLDRFFETYLEETAAAPMPLEDWVATRYDPARILSEFQSRGPVSWLVDRILRRE